MEVFAVTMRTELEIRQRIVQLDEQVKNRKGNRIDAYREIKTLRWVVGDLP